VLAHELKAAIVLFFGLLDERQRRIFAAWNRYAALKAMRRWRDY